MTNPITQLSEEEEIFRRTVRDFAEERVRPLVAQMDREASQPRALLDALFEMGLMGIETPEEYGGAGAASSCRSSRSRSSPGSIRRWRFPSTCRTRWW